MGGRAFSQLLPYAVFPRMPPSVYDSLKARVLPRMSELYTYVAVPHEAPEKSDHGDLDIVVSEPKAKGVVLHDQVREALGAMVCIPLEGDRTSNFAVPVRREDLPLMNVSEEGSEDGGSPETYHQIDVHVCKSLDDLNRHVFYYSYGDLGMIIASIAKSVGLGWSPHGLKLIQPDAPIPDLPHLHLSSSFPDMFKFFSLSQDVWSRGFTTQDQIFDWVKTSRFFDASRILRMSETKQKVKPERTMYYAFPEYIRSVHGDANTLGSGTTEVDVASVQEEALVYFGKQAEFNAIVQEKVVSRRIKEVFNGNLVKEWTGLKYWLSVKRLMDEVRLRLGEDIWKERLAEMGIEEIKSLTIEVKEDLFGKAEVEYSIV